MTTWLALLAVGTTTAPSTDWAADYGLRVAELATPEGVVQVYLPDKMAPGDSISGTVFAFGGGETVSARNANLQLLQGRELSIAGTNVKVSDGIFTFHVPADASTIEVVVRDVAGSGAVRSAVEVRPAAAAYSGIVAAPIVEEGFAIRVLGAFDGKRDSTDVKLDGIEAGVLAESPRECIVSTMNRGPGAHRLQMAEGQITLDQQINIARLTVTPPDEARIGKKSFMELVVDGLEDADPRGFPLQVVLRSSTPALLSFGEKTSVDVNQADVRGGLWKGKIEFKAKKKGTYHLSPQLVTQGFLSKIPTLR